MLLSEINCCEYIFEKLIKCCTSRVHLILRVSSCTGCPRIVHHIMPSYPDELMAGMLKNCLLALKPPQTTKTCTWPPITNLVSLFELVVLCQIQRNNKPILNEHRLLVAARRPLSRSNLSGGLWSGPGCLLALQPPQATKIYPWPPVTNLVSFEPYLSFSLVSDSKIQ